jgi:hypothetical protein
MKEASGKVCFRYLTSHWKKHPSRGEEKLFEFLLACCKLSRAEREQCEFFSRLKIPKTLSAKEREAWAKKTLAQVKSRGLGSLQLLMIFDLFDEWWNGGWKVERRRFVRLKGERHRRKKQAWSKALLVIEKNRKEAPARFLKSFGPSSYLKARRMS